MAFTAKVTEIIDIGGTVESEVNSFTDSAELRIDEAIADAQTDVLIAMVLDVSAVKAFYMVCDQNVTAEFNNSTTGTPAISLLAGIPYVWHASAYDAFLLTVDVTQLFISNASGATANLKVRALYDSTP